MREREGGFAGIPNLKMHWIFVEYTKVVLTLKYCTQVGTVRARMLI